MPVSGQERQVPSQQDFQHHLNMCQLRGLREPFLPKDIQLWLCKVEASSHVQTT